MADRRVVITGIGLVSSLGTGREAVWDAVVAGTCGIRKPIHFDSTGYRSELAAEIADYGADTRFTPHQRRRLSRSDQIAIVAAAEAVADAGLAGRVEPERTGVILGAGTADLRRNEEYLSDVRRRGFERARLSLVVNFFSNAPVEAVGEWFGTAVPGTAWSPRAPRARSQSGRRPTWCAPRRPMPCWPAGRTSSAI